VRWTLDLLVHADEPTLDVNLTLTGVPVGQRVRLRVPVPFHPRPTCLHRIERDGSVRETEIEGPFGLEAIQGPVRLCRRERVQEDFCLSVQGPGMREIELLPHKNEHSLAITLLRSRDQDPAVIRREYRLSW